MTPNVHSKAFWQQVNTEYNPKFSAFFCKTSPTFDKAWKRKRAKTEIIKYAEEFMDANPPLRMWGFVGKGFSDILFATYRFEHDNTIRRRFLDYMLQREDLQ